MKAISKRRADHKPLTVNAFCLWQERLPLQLHFADDYFLWLALKLFLITYLQEAGERMREILLRVVFVCNDDALNILRLV